MEQFFLACREQTQTILTMMIIMLYYVTMLVSRLASSLQTLSSIVVPSKGFSEMLSFHVGSAEASLKELLVLH